MKQLLFLLFAVIGLCFQSSAQTASVKNGNSVDTLKNATPISYTIPATAGYSAIGLQPVLTKVSGTVAGTVKLYGSIDGTNYIFTGDSLVLGNVTTNTAIWSKVTTPYVYYRVTFAGSGTQASIPKIYWVLRRHN